MAAGFPYYRLSGFYFFYFALLGALVPYWTLYLKSFGFSAQVIGTLMAVLHGTRVIAPNIWGWAADRTGRRLEIVRFGALMTALVFVLIFWQEGALGVGLVMAGFTFFWNAVLPQFEVITLKHLGEQKARYSQVRLWGSIGFIVAVSGLGVLLDYLPIRALPWLVLGMMVLIWLNTLLIPALPPSPAESEAGEIRLRDQLLRPHVLAFFAVCFLVQLSHGPYYTFFSVLMDQHGYSRSQIGVLWSVGVAAEVGIFILMPRLLAAFSLRRIMLISLLLCVLRWAVTALFSEQLWPMLLSQTLHAATFGCMHAVGIALVHKYFSESAQGQGQALFSSLGFGAGGAAGAFMAGLLWDQLGAELTFLLAAAAAFAAFLLAWFWVERNKLPSDG